MSSDKDTNKQTKLDELGRKLKEAAEALSEVKKDQVDKSLGQKIAALEKSKNDLEEKLQAKSAAYEELEKKLQDTITAYKELNQEKIILSDISDTAEKEYEKIGQSKGKLEKELEKAHVVSKESQQEKILLEQMVDMEKTEKHLATKKYYRAIIVSAIAVSIIFGVYSYLFAELAGQQYRIDNPGNFRSGYVIQNLKGDTVDTWLSWRLVKGDVLHVNIVNADKYPEEKVNAVKDALLSGTEIEIDDSLVGKGERGSTSHYYLGWQGALAKSSETLTQLHIPISFEVIESDQGEGDITIKLVDEKNADGFTGQTVSIADDSLNQILKSKVTIFDVDALTPEQLNAIVRHELGHVFGLAHSSDVADLMHSVIKTSYPYISECDVDAITELYDGSKSSKVVCEK